MIEDKDDSAALLPVDPSASVSTEALPTSVYLLFGSSGEYDDWRQWVIAGYASLEFAEREAERLRGLQREWREKYLAIEIPEADYDESDWWERQDQVRESAPDGVDPSDDVLFDVKQAAFFPQVGSGTQPQQEHAPSTRRSAAQASNSSISPAPPEGT